MESKGFSLRNDKETTSTTACISDLMIQIEDLSSQGKFDRVQDLLLGREKNMKFEIENLRTKCESLELQKCKCEEILEVFKRGSRNEKEKVITMLMDREEENFKKIDEKNQEISRLYEEVRNLNDQVLESNELVEVHLKEYNFLNEKLRGMKREINTLKGEKLASTLTTVELRHELNTLRLVNLEASRMLEKLNHEIVAAEVQKMKSSGIIEKMSQKELEVERFVDKMRLENLEALKTIEELKYQNFEASKNNKKLSRGKFEAEKAAEMYIKMLHQIKDITKQSAIDPIEVLDTDAEKIQVQSAKTLRMREKMITPKRKRSSFDDITRNSVPFIRYEEKVVAGCNSQKHFWNSENLSDSDSVDSGGESCSTSRINNMIASIRHQQLSVTTRSTSR